jgi:O-antigen ligase
VRRSFLVERESHTKLLTLPSSASPRGHLRARTGIALAVAGYAAVIGALVPYRPDVATAVAFTAGLAALGVALRQWHPTDAAITALLMVAATIGLPRAIQIGPVTAGGVITIATALALPLGWLLVPRTTAGRIPLPLYPLLVFVGWTLLSFAYHRPTVDGFQNVLVWVAFVGAILSSVAASRRDFLFPRRALRALGAASILALGLYAGSVAEGGFSSNAVVAPREVALFLLVGLGCGLAWYRSSQRRLALVGAALGTGLILAGLSREAFATAVVLWGVAALDPTHTRGRIRFAFAIITGCTVMYLAVQYIAPLHHRFYTGDLVHVNLGAFGTVTINSEGRSELWRTTWDSFLTSPLIGHGAGGADALITKVYGSTDGHPHNDYLRLLNDYGVAGFALWIWAYLTALWATGRAWHTAIASNSRGSEIVHLAATLSLIALGLTMITDNVMIYLYVMAPVGVLVGISIGTTYSQQGINYAGEVGA